ncbi:TauD/TfdA dioxygenase family protein [Pseudoteredinibacter isoporae]|uniref:Taurine dioxygenase n=1 Tax=Pseudoteredinibacter isoporae TaxID=570281 RepID=A0A7X0MWS9_9GAMM|nr:TauD/TfdA family dioxygenase [Pseudoteredinibacter isoporae]MBB6522510.1 taurine dioxygenase [Pseudoteredinibacter isoporae]NHO88039.1 TauD/TfdA family dioxygenase [Pseudoteredinibacter isoporae]NIB23630.1 TauD/TfdA family dioxygenase [Pseudoteredinibacter isoporae]
MQPPHCNAAKSYQHFTAKPLCGAMGAELEGLDLRKLCDDSFVELQDALDQHQMVFIKNQDLSFHDQEAITLLFGEFGTDAFTQGIEGHPNILRIAKAADEELPLVFGGVWHTDSAFLQRPPSLTLLYSRVVPPYGGDTLFGNCYLAYEELSENMKSMLEGLSGVYSMQDYFNDKESKIDYQAMDLNASDDIRNAAIHPLIRTHPRTGKKSLYANPGSLVGIAGMKPEEAQPIIEYLCELVCQPAFSARLCWEENMFVIWDNRCTVHLALNDYRGFAREMLRTTVLGERPF